MPTTAKFRPVTGIPQVALPSPFTQGFLARARHRAGILVSCPFAMGTKNYTEWWSGFYSEGVFE